MLLLAKQILLLAVSVCVCICVFLFVQKTEKNYRREIDVVEICVMVNSRSD